MNQRSSLCLLLLADRRQVLDHVGADTLGAGRAPHPAPPRRTYRKLPIEKDWRRLNLFLSIDGSFVNIWYGVIDPIHAEFEYSKEFKLPWKDYDPDEKLFRGYITNNKEAEIILNAIRYKEFNPQYLGRG